MSRELLTDEQAHPIALLRFLTKTYGSGWMEWPPSALKQTIRKDFKVAIARVNVAKALAAAAVATRDEFWQDWETFHFLCQALNNNIPTHEELTEHTVGQMMVAVDMAHQIRKELKDLSHEPTFSEEVARYIAAQALFQSIWYLPTPLGFAAPFAAKRWYKCKDCGNEAEVLFDDGLCDSCIERFDTTELGSWKPNPALIKKGWGKNIKITEKNPTEPVRKRLEKVLQSPKTVLHENRTDVCVAKLLVALNYMAHRRDQLKERVV